MNRGGRIWEQLGRNFRDGSREPSLIASPLATLSGVVQAAQFLGRAVHRAQTASRADGPLCGPLKGFGNRADAFELGPVFADPFVDGGLDFTRVVDVSFHGVEANGVGAVQLFGPARAAFEQQGLGPARRDPCGGGWPPLAVIEPGKGFSIGVMLSARFCTTETLGNQVISMPPCQLDTPR